MIFLTIGTHEPFDRLVRAVDEWCSARGNGAEVFGQITDRAAYVPRNFAHVARLDPAEYEARCRAASMLVSHAGMGSIITALGVGRPIVVMPRRGHLRETRNDHQFATAARLADRPGIHPAVDERALPEVLDRVAALGPRAAGVVALSPFADPRLTSGLADYIFGR